jgi:rRNA maturation endonuclease Nob1
MFCGKCGKELRDKAAFCASCGSPVNETREVSVSRTHRGPVNDPRRVKQTDYGLKKRLSLWNVHKVKKPELYGGYSNWTYWLFGLLSIFLAWPVALIVYLINLKSKSAVRKYQAQNLLLVAGIGFILMLGVIVEQRNEGKKVDNAGLVAADGTTYKRKEQDNRRTEKAGWECLKWGMSETEVETLLKANGFMDKSSSLDSTAADEIDLTYEANPDGSVKRVGKKLHISLFSSEETNVEITELKGYERKRPTEREIIDTFIFYQGCLVGVVTKHYGSEALDDSRSFSNALKEKYGGKIVEVGISPVRFRYASDSLNIVMYSFYRTPFTGIEINYSYPERIKSAVNNEMMRREEERKKKIKKAKDIL